VAIRKAKVIAIIPAREGSRGIPHKNIRILAGRPLLAYSIEHAKSSRLVDRVIVSTDSEEYAAIAVKYGAEVPFIRPKEIAGDESTDLEVFAHALKWLSKYENYRPDICLHLRPTYPIRECKDINSVIRIIIDNPGIDSVRSVAPARESPFKTWFINEDGLLERITKSGPMEAHNYPRQILPKAYIQNACLDAVRTSVITKRNSMTGARIYGYLMKHNFDIDNEVQFCEVERLIYKLRRKTDKPIRELYFNIEGAVATRPPRRPLGLAKPVRGKTNI
jgi:CMP-N,N'-diacetyllegionaminic acid synthase